VTQDCAFNKGHVFGGGPHIMGVVNVTPDSFSDGGSFLSVSEAIDHGLRLIDEGAFILDVGGESTRPGAQAVDVEEEIERIVPVIKGLKPYVRHISVDTRNARTMRVALDAGASSVNDISGLSYDSESIGIVSEAQVPVFLMHSQGVPESMQDNPIYNNVLGDVYNFLQEQIYLCEANCIEKNNIIIDPGIGFGKTLDNNLLILRNIKKFHDLGVPILLGTSRKSFIAMLGNDEPPDERLPGSLASALWGLSQDVQMFRVHDVKETRQAFKIYQGIKSDNDVVSSCGFCS